MYELKLEYVKHGVSEYKAILYVRGSDNKTYFTDYQMSPAFNYDKFDARSEELLKQSLSKLEWHPLFGELPI